VAGYITEYSLSVDNLFVFLVIMTSFAVPSALQHRVLLVGIVIALILRGILIVVGAEIIERFQGVFFIFAAFLFFTAWKVWSGEDEEPDPDTNRMVTFISKRVPTTTEYDGSRLVTKISGKRFLTPLALVMLAIGTTDLLFALDSIPAVFGITSEAYLVFAANAFALMGLRQLFFLIRDLITKLRHLNKGIALILVFIGVKLLLEACHSVLGWNVPLVPVWLSLVVIIAILAVTTLLSLRPQKESPAP
jgi:tellurite resistance protein TerC